MWAWAHGFLFFYWIKFYLFRFLFCQFCYLWSFICTDLCILINKRLKKVLIFHISIVFIKTFNIYCNKYIVINIWMIRFWSQCFDVLKKWQRKKLVVREPAEGSLLVPAAVWRPGPTRGHGTALQPAEAAGAFWLPGLEPFPLSLGLHHTQIVPSSRPRSSALALSVTYTQLWYKRWKLCLLTLNTK